MILDEFVTWRMVWKQTEKQRLVARRLGGFGKVYKRDDEDLNWGGGTGDGEDRFERYLKGRLLGHVDGLEEDGSGRRPGIYTLNK